MCVSLSLVGTSKKQTTTPVVVTCRSGSPGADGGHDGVRVCVL